MDNTERKRGRVPLLARQIKLVAGALFCFGASVLQAEPGEVVKQPELPVNFPQNLAGPSLAEQTTIIPEIQDRLQSFIEDRGNPVAAVVMVDVKTGNVLAVAQGRNPADWGGSTHTALHVGFPAASLFKTIVAAAGFEMAGLDPNEPIGLLGGCATVNARGAWMRQGPHSRQNKMDLYRAYGHSCNGFFAKIAINQIGLGSILTMAQRLGWDGNAIPADFAIPVSPIKVPNPSSSSVHTVGRFAAGFGYVGISAFHAAWQYLVIANNGQIKPLRLFRETPSFDNGAKPMQVLKPETAVSLRGVMDSTVARGTASFAFRQGRYRKIRSQVGGKTGTLTGHSPEGLTTWFTGMMPMEEPEVVVASVVVLEDLWLFKAASLSAEALLAYTEYAKENRVSAHKVTPPLALPN